MIQPPDIIGTATCPRCGRKLYLYAGTATYTCTVPGCLKHKFCSPHCMEGHLYDHIRERDELIVRLAGLNRPLMQRHIIQLMDDQEVIE